MQQEKKKRNPILILLGIAALIAALVLIFSKTEFGRHMIGKFYTGPHLRCNLTMTVDGKPYVPDASAVTGLALDNGAENTVSDFKQQDSGCSFRCKGGEYGAQPFQITFQAGKMTAPCVIPVQVIVPDNWRMTDVTLHIAADTEAGSYTYEITADMSGDLESKSGENEFDDLRGIFVSGI